MKPRPKNADWVEEVGRRLIRALLKCGGAAYANRDGSKNSATSGRLVTDDEN